jgi:hypothetical protein
MRNRFKTSSVLESKQKSFCGAELELMRRRRNLVVGLWLIVMTESGRTGFSAIVLK